ncbi:RNA 2',3'-cyclic phosphodiesterase [Candidatus Woesearchaeota archaeon]|nr:RNA 2',3'-cyclic phosphodiesterase [Candidatus Woesearchaeota archaeon]
MRLFIALDFGSLKPTLKDIQNQVAGCDAFRLKLTASYHCTLLFLGEIGQGMLASIQQGLSEISFAPFYLNLGSIGFFPSRPFIEVIWIGLSPRGKIKELAEKIRETVSRVLSGGKEPDTKRLDNNEFIPHITLARVKQLKDAQAALERLKAVKVKPASIEIKRFQLIQSSLTPHGPEYRVIASFPEGKTP